MAAVNFSGKWKEVRSENKEVLFAAMKLPEEVIKMYGAMKPTMEITHNGDEIQMKTMNDGVIIKEDKFTVGVRFTPKVPAGVPEEDYIASWEDGGKVLRTKNASKENGLVIDQKIDNGEVVVVETLGDVVATLFYAKV